MSDEGVDNEIIFDKLNIIRYCCKRMFLGHVEKIDEVLQHDTLPEGVHEYCNDIDTHTSRDVEEEIKTEESEEKDPERVCSDDDNENEEENDDEYEDYINM